MLALKQNNYALTAHSVRTLHTTLYDLIEAVSEVVEPGEEKLVGPVVKQLMDDYGARFVVDGSRGA